MRNRYALPLFLAISLALYANSLSGEFVFDDLSTFRRNSIREQSFLDLADDYRPVRYLSFRADEALFGDAPWGYHLSNAVLHGITSFVVFVVVRRLAGHPAALAGALLFVVHPVHTESVAYISGRRDILTTLFYLLGFLSWLEFNRTSRRLWLAGVLALYALALGAKEMAVTLPAACVLHDVLLDPARARRRVALYGVAAALGVAAAAYVVLFSRATHQHEWHGGPSLGANLAISGRLLVHYAGLLLFPYRLLGDYSYEAFPLGGSLREARAIAALLAIGAGAATAILARRRAPLVSFGLGWFLVTLLPVLQIVPFHEIAAEHYLYLPSVGFCLVLGLGFAWVRARTGPRVAWPALGLVLALLSARTVVRNRDWRDSETFWRTTLAAAPRCARAQLNVGIVHAKRSEWEDAALHMARAVEIKPDYVNARMQLGRVDEKLGRADEARLQWEEAIRISERNLERDIGVTTALRTLIACHKGLRERARSGPEAMRHDRGALRATELLLAKRPEDEELLREAVRLAQAVGDRRRADELRARLDRLQRR